MAGVSIKVEGLEALKKKFKELPKVVTTELDANLHAISGQYQNKAVQAAPVDLGLMRNSITVDHAVLNHEVVSHAPYSAYVEFGTITRVNVPPGFEEFAARFKGKGLRKTGGIHPHPFFFPHIPWAQTEVQKVAKKVIEKLKK